MMSRETTKPVRTICPKCSKYGMLREWKTHGRNGNFIRHKKRANESYRCYIDPLTSINIKAGMGMEEQKQQKLF
jgi:hypothetical protein